MHISKHIVTRIGIRILFQGDIKSCLTLILFLETVDHLIQRIKR